MLHQGGKFTDTVRILKESYAKGGVAFPGIDKLVITAKEIKSLGAHWSIGAGDRLLYDGTAVVVEGLEVVVKKVSF